jgi:hypothetical protein
MATTYEKIATTTLGSSAADITFSSIAATYTDLRVVVVGRVTDATTNAFLGLYPNNDTASNYSRTQLSADGATVESSRTTSATYAPIGTLPGSSVAAGIPHYAAADIFSYAGSTYKTWLWESNGDQNGSGRVYRGVALWRSTSAITSIVLKCPGGQTLATGTTATLYGILKA